MNENVKMFIKKVNEDESLKKEFSEINDKLKVELDRENLIKTHIIPFAKKAGCDLTMADFGVEGELSDEELMAVSGGGGSGACVCVGAGGGGGTDSRNSKVYGCGCSFYGQGGDGSAGDCNCICFVGGVGNRDNI